MAKIGAKSKLTEWLEPDNLILLKGWAREGLTDEQIAKNMNIHVSTLYEYKKKNKEFSDALKFTKDIADYEVESALFKNAINGNVTAQIFWLKNRKKDQWREKIELPTNPQDLAKVNELLSKIQQEANNDTK